MPEPLPPGIPHGAPSLADGRYLLVGRIGEGGVAGVYRAWDDRLRVWRAIKVLQPQYARVPGLRHRFEAEAHTMAHLEHPNLVRIYDVGEAGELPFMVMELVEGGTLHDWVNRHGRMSPRLACEVLLQVAAGVRAAHDAGVIHRDIKPRNVLITTAGRCKLTDFGIALREEPGITKTGVAMGTQGYMSPEQRRDARAVDRRTDIYSLGATLWALLAGEQPHDLFHAAVQPALLAKVPGALRAVTLRACAYEPADRYSDVALFERDLRAVMEILPGHPRDRMPLAHSPRPFEEHLPEPELLALLSEPPPKPAAEAKPLPYYMPAKADRQRSLSGEELPDYVDRSTLGAPRREALSDSIPPPPVPKGIRSVTPVPAPRIDPGDGLGPAETLGVDDSPVPAPPRRVRPRIDWRLPVGALFSLAFVPVLGALLFLLVGSYNLSRSARQTSVSRAQIYAVLGQHPELIARISGPWADRPTLEAEFLRYLEQDREPERIEAAIDFLDGVELAISARPSNVSQLDEGTWSVVRQLRVVRQRYERDRNVWQARAGSLTGSLLVTVGLGPAPPEPP